MLVLVWICAVKAQFPITP